MDAGQQRKTRVCRICGQPIVLKPELRYSMGNIRNRFYCDAPECLRIVAHERAKKQRLNSTTPEYRMEFRRSMWTHGALMQLTATKFAKVVTLILDSASGVEYKPMPQSLFTNQKESPWNPMKSEMNPNRTQVYRLDSLNCKVGGAKRAMWGR